MENSVKIDHVDNIVEQVSLTISGMNDKVINEKFAGVQQRLLNTVVAGKRDQLRHNVHVGNVDTIQFYK